MLTQKYDDESVKAVRPVPGPTIHNPRTPRVCLLETWTEADEVHVGSGPDAREEGREERVEVGGAGRVTDRNGPDRWDRT